MITFDDQRFLTDFDRLHEPFAALANREQDSLVLDDLVAFSQQGREVLGCSATLGIFLLCAGHPRKRSLRDCERMGLVIGDLITHYGVAGWLIRTIWNADMSAREPKRGLISRRIEGMRENDREFLMDAGRMAGFIVLAYGQGPIDEKRHVALSLITGSYDLAFSLLLDNPASVLDGDAAADFEAQAVARSHQRAHGELRRGDWAFGGRNATCDHLGVLAEREGFAAVLDMLSVPQVRTLEEVVGEAKLDATWNVLDAAGVALERITDAHLACTVATFLLKNRLEEARRAFAAAHPASASPSPSDSPFPPRA
ncbi:hypothetical protein HLV35_01135 [Eggerthellaceae bacterium zg-997]|nr:hypothetical protein [Eggerthellaceae bacterium zg-997]